MKARLSVVVVAIVLGAVAYLVSQPAAVAQEKAQPTMTLKVYDDSGQVLVNVKAKVRPAPKNNAFDVMRGVVAVDFDTYPANLTTKPPFKGGPLITAIVGVLPPANKYWFLYVDGTKSDEGISQLRITKDTLIEWKIEEFKSER
jgi:hypothetical protein